MTSQEIKNLQTQLNAKGAGLKVDGIMGPKTQAAMNQFATSVASAPAGMTKQDIMALQTQLNESGAGLLVDGVLGPKTTSAMNSAVSKSLSTNPATQSLVSQNDPDAIVNAYMTGDWTNINDITGQPFSKKIVNDTIAQAEEDIAPAYRAQEAYDQGTVESSLQGSQDQMNQFLQGEAVDFQAEKEDQDLNAADQGVLFSGSRYQKLNDLKTKYDTRLDNQITNVGRNVQNTALANQYKYGDQAANKLSDYYKLGSQTYDPNVARGGVKQGTSLSAVYNPSQYNFQGTAPVANKAAAQTRAASLLTNRANKLVPGGYKNQF